MECSVCHTQLPDNARFCVSCGTPVGASLHPRVIRQFFAVVEVGDVEEAERMLEAEPGLAHARTKDTKEKTALHIVAESKHENAIEMAGLLLDWEADVNALATLRRTPLNYAIEQGSLAMCRELVNHEGRYSHHQFGESDYQSLWYTVANGDRDKLIYLITMLGLDPNEESAGGETLLQYIQKWNAQKNAEVQGWEQEVAKIRAVPRAQWDEKTQEFYYWLLEQITAWHQDKYYLTQHSLEYWHANPREMVENPYYEMGSENEM